MFIEVNHLIIHQYDDSVYYTTEKMLINSDSIEYIVEGCPPEYKGDAVAIKLYDAVTFIYAAMSYDMMCLLMNNCVNSMMNSGINLNSMITEAQEDNDWK